MNRAILIIGILTVLALGTSAQRGGFGRVDTSAPPLAKSDAPRQRLAQRGIELTASHRAASWSLYGGYRHRLQSFISLSAKMLDTRRFPWPISRNYQVVEQPSQGN